MDGKSFFHPKNVPGDTTSQGESKEVNKLNDFIFDLQRFDDEPAADAAEQQTWTLTINDGKTVLTLTSEGEGGNKTITVEADSSGYFTIKDGLTGTNSEAPVFNAGDIVKVEQKVDLGGKKLLIQTEVNLELANEITSTTRTVYVDNGGTLNVSAATNATENAKITTTSTTAVAIPIYVRTGGTLNIESGTIEAITDANASNSYVASVSGYGIYLQDGAVVNQSGGTVSAGGYAIVSQAGGTYNLSGGEIKNTAQKFKSSDTTYYAFAVNNAAGATFNMTGGSIGDTGDTKSYNAIYNAGTVSVSGGTLTSTNETVRKISNGTATVTGGKFSDDVSAYGSFTYDTNYALVKTEQGEYYYYGADYDTTIKNATSVYKTENIDGKTVKYYTTQALKDAEKIVAYIGKDGYTSLANAFAAAADGQTIKLNDNVTLDATSGYINVNKNVTLDLNGKTVTKAGSTLFIVHGGKTFTVDDNSSSGGGQIVNTGKSITVQIGFSNDAGTFNLKKGTVKSNSSSSIYVVAGSTFDMDGGEIVTNIDSTSINNFTVGGKGTDAEPYYIQTPAVTVNGGTVEMSGGKIYASITTDLLAYTGKDNDGQSKPRVDDTGVVLWANSTFDMTGGTIMSYHHFALTGNGSASGDNYGGNTKIYISGDSKLLAQEAAAIYHPQVDGSQIYIGKSKAEVEGSSTATTSTGSPTIIGGDAAIEIRAGELFVTKGTLIAGKPTFASPGNYTANTTVDGGVAYTGTASYSYTQNGNGSTTTGAAIAIAQHTTKRLLDVYIGEEGGEDSAIKVKGAVAVSVANPQANPAAGTPIPSLTIHSGTFTGTQQISIAAETLEYSTATSSESASNVSDSRVVANIFGGIFTGALNKNGTQVTNDTGGTYETVEGLVFSDLKYVPAGYGYKEYTTTTATGDVVTSYKVVESGTAVARIDGKEFTSLEDAIAAVGTTYTIYVDSEGKPVAQGTTGATAVTNKYGNTIILLSDISALSAGYAITDDIILNLNGYAITQNNNSSATVFSVGKAANDENGEAPTFTIIDDVLDDRTTTGKIEYTKTFEGSLIEVSDGSTFNIRGGTLTTKRTAISAENASKVFIAGDTTISITGGTADSGYAVVYEGGSTVTIGEKNGKLEPTITLSLSASGVQTYAVYGKDDQSTLNVYGGSINVANTRGVDHAIHAAGNVNILGGSIIAQEGAVYLESSAKATVGGATLNATAEDMGYGLYIVGTDSVKVLGDNTFIQGTKNAVSASVDNQNISFGVGAVFGDVTTTEYTYYEKDASGNYTFHDATLTAGENGYTYKLDSNPLNGVVDKAGTIAFEGNLLKSDNLDAALISIAAGEDDTEKLIRFDDAIFDKTDGASLKVSSTSSMTGSYKLDTAFSSESSLSNITDAGAYYSADTLVAAGSNYAYYSPGADRNGFTRDTTAGSLTYHTVRADGFTFTGDISLNSAAASDPLSYFSISGSAGNKTVTIFNEALFAADQTENATLYSPNAGYKLALGGTITPAVVSENATFKQEAAASVYSYIFPGADKNGFAVTDDTVGTIQFFNAADKFSFKDDTVSGVEGQDKYVNFNASGTETITNFFDVTGDATNGWNVTVKAAALQTLQAEGAQLVLADDTTNVTLHYADGLVKDATVNHAAALTENTITGDVAQYTYNTAGMFVTAEGGYTGGYTYDESGDNGASLLTYHAGAQTLGVEATGVTLNTNASYYTFENGIFQIETISAFGDNLSEGDVIKLSGSENYTLALSSTGNFDTVASNLVQGTATYNASNLTYTGKGASVAGFESKTDGSFVYHDQYAQFSFAGGDNTIGLANGFENKFTFGEGQDSHTIYLNANSFGENANKNGYSLQLSEKSITDKYKLALNNDLNEITYKESTFENNTYSKTYIWRSAGANMDDEEAGYALTNDTLLTYYDLQKEIEFNINGIKLVDENGTAAHITLGADNIVSIGKAAFDTEQEFVGQTATLGIVSDNASEYGLALGSDVDLAKEYRTAAEFSAVAGSSSVYTYAGAGASTVGYQAADNVITYYGKADYFTLAGDVAFNSFTTDTEENAKFFTITRDEENTAATVEINKEAISGDLTTGMTISLTAGAGNGTYAFDIGTNLNKAASADDIQMKESITSATSYMGIGVKEAEGTLGSFLSDGTNAFKFYEVADKFNLASGTNSIGFDTSVNQTLMAAAIDISAADGSTVKNIYIKDKGIFKSNELENGYTLALADGSTMGYNLKLESGATNLPVNSDTVAASFEVGGTNKYVYTALGGSDTTGFYQTSDDVITYYNKSEKVTVSGDIAFNVGGIQSDLSLFDVNTTTNTITLAKGALSDTLTNGTWFSISAADNGDFYTVGFATDAGYNTIDNADSVQKEAAFTSDQQYIGMGVSAESGEAGFLAMGETGSVTGYTYYKVANKLKLEAGENALAFDTAQTTLLSDNTFAFLTNGNNATVTINDGRIFNVKSGQTLAGASGYTLKLGADKGDTLHIVESGYEDAVTGSLKTITGGYTFKGFGADQAGFREKATNSIIYYGLADKVTLTGDLKFANSVLSAMNETGDLYFDTANNVVSIKAGAIDLASIADKAVISISGSNDGDYSIALNGDWTTVDSNAYGGYATIESGGNFAGYSYVADGAATDGYELSNSNKTLTFYNASDRFTLNGDLFTERIKSNPLLISNYSTIGERGTGTIGSFNLQNDLFRTDLSNQATLSIVSGDPSRYQYTLNADALTQASDIHTIAAFNVDESNNYIYKSAGSSVAGFHSDGNLLTFYKKYDNFSIDGSKIALYNQSSVASTAQSLASDYIGFTEGETLVTVKKAAIITESLQSGVSKIQFVEGTSSGYGLTIETGNGTDDWKILAADKVNLTTALKSSVAYAGMGGTESKGFYDDSVSSFTYYDKAYQFDLESGDNNVVFNTEQSSLAADAFTFNPATGANTTVTIVDGRVFATAQSGAVLALKTGTTDYSLELGAESDNLNTIAATDLQLVEAGVLATVDGSSTYNYEFIGYGTTEDKAGFHYDTKNSAIKYYNPAETFKLAGNVEFKTNEVGEGFKVDTDTNMVTISATAIEMGSLTGGETFQIAEGDYSIALGTGMTAEAATTAKWNANNLTWTNKGYQSPSFSLTSAKQVEFLTPAEEVTFADSGIDFADSGVENGITLLEDGKTVSVAAAALGSEQEAGAILQLAETSASKYSLDLSALNTMEGNTYNSTAIFGENATLTNGYTYTGEGMLKENGFDITSTVGAAIWRKQAEKVSFIKNGENIAFAADNVAASKITVKDSKVTIDAAAFANTTNWANTNSISITSGQTLDKVTNLSLLNAAAVNTDATFDGTTYTSAGARSNPGFYLKDSKELIYYSKSQVIEFEGSLLNVFNGDKTLVANNITVDGTKVIINKAAFNDALFNLAQSTYLGQGAETLRAKGNYNIVLAGSDLATTSGNQTSINFDLDTKTYTGKGAATEGFTVDENGVLTYWRPYNKFTFEGEIGFADTVTADSFTVTSPTYQNVNGVPSIGKQGTIQIDKSALVATKGGQQLILSADSASMFSFNTTGLSTIDNSNIYTTNNFSNETGAFIVGGDYVADKAGYLPANPGTANADTLTYYAEADKFTLGSETGTNQITFISDMNGVTNPDGFIDIVDSYKVRLNQGIIDEKKLVGGETLMIIAQNNEGKYSLDNAGLTNAGSVYAASFDNDTGIFAAKGTTKDGYVLADNILTYYKKAAGATLDASAATFNADTASLGTYFSLVNGLLTIKDDSFINLVNGQTTLRLADSDTTNTLKIADDLLAQGDITTATTLNNKIYTSAGALTEAGFSTVGGAASGDEYIYRAKSDRFTFEGNIGFSSAAVDNISLAAGTGAESSYKYISFGMGAFDETTLAEGHVVSLSSADTAYKLDLTLNGLTTSGKYASVASFDSITGTENKYAYYGVGAEADGFDTMNGGLIYHKQRADQFTLDSAIALNTVGSNNIDSYFNITEAGGVKTVVIDSDLFKATTEQTDKATLSISGGNYNLTLAAGDTVEWIDDATFNGTIFNAAGAAENGYKAENNVITYYQKAMSFTFGPESGTTSIAFNERHPGDDYTTWFAYNTVDTITTVTVNSALALNANQTDGATLTITNAEAGHNYKVVTDAIDENNPYKSENEFAKAETGGGGIYYKTGMESSNGYALVGDNEILTYHTVRSSVTFTGDIVFNTLEAGEAVDAAISVDDTGKVFTLDKTAFASTGQTNLATLEIEDGYTLNINDNAKAVNPTKIATIDALRRYKGAGAATAGYSVEGGKVVYYDKQAEITFGGDAKFIDTLGNALKNPLTAPIQVNDTVVTVSREAFVIPIEDGSTFYISKGNYDLKFAENLDGGKYDSDVTFDATTKKYKYAGADSDGFVKETEDATEYVYHSGVDTIGFAGNIDFTTIEAAEAAKLIHISSDGTVRTVMFDDPDNKLFLVDDNDYASLTFDDATAAKGTFKLAISDSMQTASGTFYDEASLASDGGKYIFTGTGVDGTAGYLLDEDTNTLTYRAPVDKITFMGKLKLNADTTAAGVSYTDIRVSNETVAAGSDERIKKVTLTKNALADEQESGSTLEIETFYHGTKELAAEGNYRLVLNIDDNITAWALQEGDSLAVEGTNGTYSTKGYTETGYQANNNIVTYYEKNQQSIEITGLDGETRDTTTVVLLNPDDDPTTRKTFEIKAAAFVNSADANDSISVAEGYKISLGSGQSDTTAVEATVGSANQIYRMAGTTAGFNLTNDDRTLNYYKKTGQEEVKFTGLDVSEYVNTDNVKYLGNNTFTVDEKAFVGDAKVSDTVTVQEGYTLAFTESQKDDAPAPVNAKLENQVYTSSGTKAGYRINNGSKSLYYDAATGQDTIQFAGLGEGANPTNVVLGTGTDSSVFTISEGALGESGVTVASGYSLVLAGANTLAPETTPAYFEAMEEGATTAFYHSATVKAGWEVNTDDKTQIIYTKEDQGESRFRLSGISKAYASMVGDDNVVTVKKDDLADGAKTVKLDNDEGIFYTNNFTLLLDGVVDTPSSTSSATFGTVEDSVATYTQTDIFNEYWSRAVDSLSYDFIDSDTVTTALFTLTGVKTVEDNMVGTDNVVTVDKDDLADGAKALTLTKGDSVETAYTLKLTNVDEALTSTSSATFGTVADSAATYTQTDIFNEYWTRAADSLSYALTDANTVTNNLFTLTGVKTVDNNMVGTDNVVTVDKADLADDAKTLTLTKDDSVETAYTLKLEGVAYEGTPTVESAFGKFDETNHTAVYTKTTSVNSFWTQGTDSLSYTFTDETITSSDQFTLKGVTNTVTDNILTSVEGGGYNVTISADYLAQGATLVGVDADNTTGFTLTLANDIEQERKDTISADWVDATAPNNKATYRQSTDYNAYWAPQSGEANSLDYYLTKAGTDTLNLFTLNGIKGTDVIDVQSVGSGTSLAYNVTVEAADVAEGATLFSWSKDSDNVNLTFDANFNAKETTTGGFGQVDDNHKVTFTATTTNVEYWKQGEGADSLSYTKYDATTKAADLFVIEGVGSNAIDFTEIKDGDKVVGYNVTVDNTDLHKDAKELKLTKTDAASDYTFNLNLIGVETTEKPTVNAAAFGSITGSQATYTQTTNYNEYWKQGEGTDSLTYTKTPETVTSSNLFTLNGISTVYSGMVTSVTGGGYDVKVNGTTDLADGAKTLTLTKGEATGALTLDLTNVNLTNTVVAGTSNAFDYASGTATYQLTTEYEDYWKKTTADTSTSYALTTVASSAKDIFTLTGVNESIKDTEIKDGKTVTIVKDNISGTGTDINVKLENKEDYTYELALGEDLAAEKSTSVSKHYDGSTKLFHTKGSSAGYELENNTITYTKGSSLAFELEGVPDGTAAKHFAVNTTDKTLTLGDGAVPLDGTTVKLVSAPEEGYKLALGKGMVESESKSKGYENETKTFYTKGVTTGYKLTDKTINYVEGTSLAFKLNGVPDDTAAKHFAVDTTNKKLTLGDGAIPLDGTTVELVSSPNDEYTLALGKGMVESDTVKKAYDSDTKIFHTAGTTTGYNLTNTTITYVDGTSLNFELKGVPDNTAAKHFAVNTTDKTLTLGSGAIPEDGTTVELVSSPDDEYKLALGKGMTESKTVQKAYESDTKIFHTAGTTTGYNLTNTTITYVDGTSLNFELKGVPDNTAAKHFAVNTTDKTLTLGDGAIPKDGTTVELVSAPDDEYTFALGKNLTESDTVKKGYDSETKTFHTAGTTTGYKLTDKTITYVEGTSLEFELEGVPDKTAAKHFAVDTTNHKLTLGDGAVPQDGTVVKLISAPEDDYTLALGKGMTESTSVAKGYDSATKTFRTKGTTTGYKLTDNTITYVEGTSLEFELEGVPDGTAAKHFAVDTTNHKLTLGDGAIPKDGTVVSLISSPNNEYTFALGKNLTESGTVKKGYDSETKTFRTAGTTAGYVLTDNTITYTEGTSLAFELEGVPDDTAAKHFAVDTTNKKLTLGDGAIPKDGTVVKLVSAPEDGYTFALGKNLSAPTTSGTLDNGNYTLKTTKAGYVLGSNTIKYVAASTDPTLELSGIATEPDAPEDGVVTLKVANFNSGNTVAVTSNSGGYEFNLASGTYTGKTFTGSKSADTITSAGKNLVINGGSGADSITSTGAGSTINGGAGADTLYGGAGAQTLDGGAANDEIHGGAGNDSLFGGAGNDKLYGDAGADTLWGGAGNDSLYGGAGNDTFIYKPGEGTDTIYDYGTGSDLLQIIDTSGNAVDYDSATFSNNRLTLTVGSGTLRLEGIQENAEININGETKTVKDGTLK